MVRDHVVAAAERAAALKLVQVQNRAQQVAAGGFASSDRIWALRRVFEKGFREICHAAVGTVAMMEGADAIAYVDVIRAPLLGHQLAIDRVFSALGALSPPHMARLVRNQRTETLAELDRILDAVMEDLANGMIGGRTIEAFAADGRESPDGSTALVVVPAAGRMESAGEVGDDIDPDALREAFAALRRRMRSLPVMEQLAIEDAIAKLEKELARPAPDPARLQQLLSNLAELSGQAGIGLYAGVAER
jgi:hypothetical protein